MFKCSTLLLFYKNCGSRKKDFFLYIAVALHKIVNLEKFTNLEKYVFTNHQTESNDQSLRYDCSKCKITTLDLFRHLCLFENDKKERA